MKNLFNAVIVIGMILLLGTAGVSDTCGVGFDVIAGRAAVSLCLIGGGAAGKYFWRSVPCLKIQIKRRKSYIC